MQDLRGIVARSAIYVGAFVALIGILNASPVQAHQDPDHELSKLQQLMVKAPHDLDLLLEAGSLLRSESRFEEARSILLLAEALSPDDDRVMTALGRTYMGLGWYREAEATFDRALDSSDVSQTVYFLRGQALVAQGMYVAALADFDRAMLSVDEQGRRHFMVDACLSKASLLQQRGQSRKAAETLVLARRHSAASAIDRALIQLHLQSPTPAGLKAALLVADTQVARAPISTEWRLLQAEILAAQGLADRARQASSDALEEAERSVSLRPTAAALLWRARANYSLGEFDLALFDARQASLRAPRLSPARRLVQRIESEITVPQIGALR